MNEQLHVTSKDDLGKWWAPLHRVPHTINHKANYVLYPAELAEYLEVLNEIATETEVERTRVRAQLRWMERGHIMWHESPRHPHTLADALNFMLKKGKATLKLLQMLTAATHRRNTHQEEAQ